MAPSNENLELSKKRANIRTAITKAFNAVNTRTNFGDNKVTRAYCKQLSDSLFSCDHQINDDSGPQYYETLRKISDLIDEEEERIRLQFENDQKRRQEEEARAQAAEDKALEIKHKREKERLELELLTAQLEQTKLKPPLSSLPSSSQSPTVVVRSVGDEAKVSPFDGTPSRYQTFEEEFTSQYETDASLNDAAKFLAFKNLCGNHGKEVIGCLKPTADGLATAKERMQEWFSEPTRVRESIRRSFEQLKPIKNRTCTRQLTSLLITAEEGVQALKNCGTSAATINETFLNLIVQNLPQSLTSTYHRDHVSWDADQFLDHLRKEIKHQEGLNERHSIRPSTEPKREKPSKANLFVASPSYQKSSAQTHHSNQSTLKPMIRVCSICNGDHLTIFCNHADVTTRKSIVNQKNLCTRCLRVGHLTKDCRSKYTCPCGEPHSRVICLTGGVHSTNPPQTTAVKQAAVNILTPDDGKNNSIPNHLKPLLSPSITTIAAKAPTQTPQFVSSDLLPIQMRKKYARTDLVSFMSTVLVNINNQLVRVLLDSAAGRTVVEESLANRLGLEIYDSHSLNISGFNGKTTNSERLVNATLTSITNGQSMDIVFSVVPSLNNLMPPVCPPEFRNLLVAKGYQLTDSHERLPIGMIIGVEKYEFIRKSSTQITEDLHIVDTIFGPTLYGCTPMPTLSNPVYLSVIQTSNSNPLPPIEKKYLEEFSKNNISFENNQYSVKLPWIRPVDLHSYKDAALCRLKRLLNSLKSRGLLSQYTEAMNEVINNFAERAPIIHSNRTYYLAHHCVLRPDKTTSQIRIVFDGSAHEPDRLPLNDCIYKGVNSWNSLNLLLRFRFGKTAIAADIEKAFLTIKVDPSDRDALRFWWINENNEPIAYRFTSVPFGTSASPFLLYAVMEKHLSNNLEKYPFTVSLIRNNFYVDDLLLAVENLSIEQVEQLKQETVTIFSSASMNVRKWRSNNPTLDHLWSPGAPDSSKTLGHHWNIPEDMLSLETNLCIESTNSRITKRIFSSILASVYDPMGLIAPFVVQLRLFLRKLWKAELDWDDTLPQELHDEALTLINDVHLVKKFTVKRNVITGSPATLLLYCDASKHAVGVAAYTMTETSTELIFAKSQLARDTTMPELELDALLMSAEVANYLCKLADLTSDSIKFNDVVVCGDSLLNLQRLIKHPNDQRPSVALKVNQIQKLIPSARFRHVQSADNIADLISRGCSIKELLQNPKWLHAPPPADATRFDHELKTSIFAIQTNQSTKCSCIRHPNFGSALKFNRLFARLILRFGKHEYYRKLTEHDLAMILLIRGIQQNHFKQELDDLKTKNPINKTSLLHNYKCVLDESNLIRLQTRMLKGPNLTDDETSPSVLPHKCHLSDLLIQFEHDRLGHPGVDRTLAAVRSRVFIIKLRKSVVHLISRCRICRTLRGKTSTVDLGSIPRFRYDERTPAFTNVGLDIFGPLTTAMTTPGKRYGVIFACATTRAVHLELISNQTAAEVYLALRKFVARRGIPKLIYSDNGLQLIAVEKRFLKLVHQLSREYSKPELRLKWIHLTPLSPWRGGFYERLIATVKATLKALTFKTILTDRKLETILYEIEALMNSRPLFTFEGQVVTPAHFFAGRSLVQLPRVGNTSNIDKPDIIKEYLANDRHKNAVWSKFHDHYLLQLKSMHQNLSLRSKIKFKPNDVVLLKNSTPPDYWPIGIIEHVQPSPDGQVRTVFLRTTDRGKTVVKARDVRTLIPLECHGESDTEPPNLDVELKEPDLAKPQQILIIINSLLGYPTPPESHK